ncbi:uncharacterized protein LOC141691202 [Apium graveolens]|uniref:uncharacterized protein LOC141691202 n=1 Tax=Apium graveolens TaxID=4045 RepID=UPI003D7ADCB2
MDLGPPSKICRKCNAVMWNEERNNKSSMNSTPTFTLCCKDGQVRLPPEKKPPPFLASLLSGGEKSSHFKKNMRPYNSLFQFTSIGGKIDRKINNGGGPYCFKLNGQNYHLIGSLKPKDGQPPKFCQLYVYDTENEVVNRMNDVPGSDSLDPEIVQGLLDMLDEHNQLAQGFRYARDRLNLPETDDFHLLLVSSKSASGRPNQVGPSNEVAALLVGDSDDTCPFRDIVVQTKERYLKRVFETCKHFMQLQYPLLFPYGDDGFHLKIPLHNKKHQCQDVETDNDQHPDETHHRTTVTIREYYAYKLMIRPDEGMNLHLGGRLWQQFVVDAFAAVEQYRLDWIRNHQSVIRSDLYRSIRDSVAKGDTDLCNKGKNVILPATHTGSQRYMNQYFKDSLAICRTIGHPSLFLTMTCNTQWPEIKSMMEHFPGVDVADKPDVIARVFKLKLDQLLDLIKKKIILNTMIHGPCGKDYSYSPYMVKGQCGRHFPKKYNANTFFDDCGFPVYRRRRTELHVEKKGVKLDNQFVVPYDRDLLIRFHCHINLEVCNSSRSLKYLFKYCLKGHDTATMLLRKKHTSGETSTSCTKPKIRDKIKNFLDGRYICASEAAWRLLGFDIHHRFPSVDRLLVHLEGEKNVSFKKHDNLQDVADRAKMRFSKLEGWFEANKNIPEARQFTYNQFPQYFTWKGDVCRWKIRERGTVFGRLSDVHASSGETFFLRMILMHIKGATSFRDLRTVNGIVYNTYKEVCDALGLLNDDRQWHIAMSENAVHAMPYQPRQLFVFILSNNQVADPLKLWTEHWKALSDDVLYSRRKSTGNIYLQLSESDIQNITLAEIEKLFNDVGKSLKDFTTLPVPDPSFLHELENRLISEELGYNRDQQREEHEKLFRSLNEDQLQAYTSIISSVENKAGGIFFVYGSGGCGKTFLWKTLCCKLRSLGSIVLPVASSGIAATLLPGGRTAHSRFHIPLKLDQCSVAGIKHGTELGELIKNTGLIIWDEAPMQHRHSFESVDRSLRDIMSSVDPLRAGLPFGGITIVFGGDFRQILPVIPKASRAQIVGASLNSSKLWQHCQVFLLEKNMRLTYGSTEAENKEIAKFSKWVLDVGDGTLPNIHPDDVVHDPDVSIPEKFIIRSQNKPIKHIVDKIYPNISKNIVDPDYLKERSILTPTNAIVNDINSYILDLIPGTTHTYLSQDSLCDNSGHDNDFGYAFPVEYLNSINMPCLPRHDLKIKVGCVIMLMRNLNQIMGLCNGTRMIVKKCLPNSIICEVLTGSQVGTIHIIPRIEMVPTDTAWPFEFKRVQFPVQLCFDMTINKSQVQSLNKVGLYLPRSVFMHGQLYVVVSRVTSPSGLHILIDSETGGSTNVTANVVFEEVFYNLPVNEHT